MTESTNTPKLPKIAFEDDSEHIRVPIEDNLTVRSGSSISDSSTLDEQDHQPVRCKT